jgi:hypothetical protein
MSGTDSILSKVSQLVNKFLAFMEPEGSVLYSHDCTTGLSPQPVSFDDDDDDDDKSKCKR